jgi:hypothetical protein
LKLNILVRRFLPLGEIVIAIIRNELTAWAELSQECFRESNNCWQFCSLSNVSLMARSDKRARSREGSDSAEISILEK